MKINFIDWLKKTPAVPTYSSSQKKQQQAQTSNQQNTEGGQDGTESASVANDESNDMKILHKQKYFFEEDLMTQPEFRYENKIDVLKKKDKAMIIEYLEMKEK